MPPPSLPDDLIEEVLLRVRADDPASLVRAALACRRWCRLVADPAFRRRRLDHHGAMPPMLGFLCQCNDDKQSFARFVPTSTCCPPRADHRGLRALDARHGRVLLQDRLRRDFVVWDPVTDQRVVLPRPPPPPWTSLSTGGTMKATVLCAATATGVCNHLDCHRGHFIVVLVGKDLSPSGTMFTCIYSSKSGAWSDPTYHANRPVDNMDWGRSALVGSKLFLKLCTYNRILKYDLCTQETSVVGLPPVRAVKTSSIDLIQLELIALEDGQLGFVRREASSKLCLWSWDDYEGDDQVAVGSLWTRRRVIDLKKLFPLVDSHYFSMLHLVGVVEGVCVAIMTVEKCGLFTIDMKTGLMKKVSTDFGSAYWIVPYIDFCTPALPTAPRDDEPVE